MTPAQRGSSLQSAQSVDSTDGVIAAQESLHDQVIRELAEITATYSNTSRVGLVLAATQSEDLQWLLEYCRERFVYP